MDNKEIEEISGIVADEVWNSPLGEYIQDDSYQALTETAKRVINLIMEKPLYERLTQKEVEKVKDAYRCVENARNSELEFYLSSIFGPELFAELDE